MANTGCKKQPEEIKIGAIMPLTGDYATYGIAIKRGIELAVEEINNNRGINGKILDLIFEDSRAEPRLGTSAAHKLIDVDHVPVIIGAVASSVTLSIAPIAENNKVVLISAASSSPKITPAGDYIFRNYPSDVLEGNLVAEFAMDNGYKTTSILTIQNEYGVGLNKVFEKNYEKLGGKVLSNDSYLEGTRDFRTTLAKIKEQNPSSIFIVGYGREMGTAIKQAREIGIKSQFLSTVNFYDEESIKAGGSAVNGVIFSSPVFDPNSEQENIRIFVGKFRNKFKAEPDVWSAHGYDAVLLVAEAMKNKGFLSDEIKEGLYQIKDFPGVSGNTSFDQNGDVIKTAQFLIVENGEFVPLHKIEQ